MMIDKIGGIGPSYGARKPEPVSRPADSGKITDNVEISDEAARAVDMARVSKLVQNTEDTARADKLREVKERLESGVYDNPTDEMLDSAADRLTDAFMGG